MAINEKRVGRTNPVDGRITRNPGVCYVSGEGYQWGDVRIELPDNRFVYVNATVWRKMSVEQKNQYRAEWGLEPMPTEDELIEAEIAAEAQAAKRSAAKPAPTTKKDGE
jgi:hypothetical protein